MDRSNPLTVGMQWLLNFNGSQVVDLANGLAVTATGVAPVVYGNFGRGVVTTAGTTNWTLPDSAITKNTGAITAFSFTGAPTALNAGVIKSSSTGANNNEYNLGWNSSSWDCSFVRAGSGSNSTAFMNANAFTGKANNAFVAVSCPDGVVSNVANWKFYLKGVLQTTFVSATGTGNVITSPAPVRLNTNASAQTAAGTYCLVGIMNRALSDAEHWSLGQNPWQLFAPIKPVIYNFPSLQVGGLR